MSLFALLTSSTTKVYRYLLQRTLNLTTSFVFLIFTAAERRTGAAYTVSAIAGAGCGRQRAGRERPRAGREQVESRGGPVKGEL